MKALLLQTMDGPSKKVRQAASHSLASVLLSVKANNKSGDTMNDSDLREARKRRGNATINLEEQEDGRSSPAPAKSIAPIPLRMDILDLLRQISTAYSRCSSRYVRTGLVITYAAIFKSMGASQVGAIYRTIVEHVLTDVAAHPLIGNDRFRAVEARRHIQFLLENVIRRQLLDEPGKLIALRTIIKMLSKAPDTKGADADHWPIEATISALGEIAGIIQDLGSAVSVDQVIQLMELSDLFLGIVTGGLYSLHTTST